METGNCRRKTGNDNLKLLVSSELLCYDGGNNRKGGDMMRMVKCYDCGKKYNFDVDDFCPGCGAFTPPPRTARIDLDGSVVRVEGINEQNHEGSFVHAELHEENRERRGTVLERSPARKMPRPQAVRSQSTGRRLTPPTMRDVSRGFDFLGDAVKLFSDFLDS